MGDKYKIHETRLSEYGLVDILYRYESEQVNPRTWDNVGAVICWHKRYALGDRHKFAKVTDFAEYLTGEEVDDPGLAMQAIRNWEHGVVLPLFLLDHSGLSISTTPFRDSWDSSIVGFIHVTNMQLEKDYGHIPCKAEVTKWLESEVYDYNAYLTGNIYEITACLHGEEPNPDIVPITCYGYKKELFTYYGDEMYNELVEHIRFFNKKEIQKHVKYLRKMLKSKVIHLYRKPLKLPFRYSTLTIQKANDQSNIREVPQQNNHVHCGG